MTQAIQERCSHGMLRGFCVMPNCEHYDGEELVTPAERPKLLTPPPEPISRPYVDHPGAVEKRERIRAQRKQDVLHPESSPLRKRALDIAYIVAEDYLLGVEHLIGERRFKELLEPRHVLFFLCRNATTPRWSYPSIGFALGRDHSTVMSAESKVMARMVDDYEFCQRVEALAERVRNLEERRRKPPEIPELEV